MEISYGKQPDVFAASVDKIAHLILADVRIGDITVPLVYDTGAAMTVVRESVAHKANLPISDETVSGGGNAGGTVSGRSATIKELVIGHTAIRRLPIAVVSDETLDFGKDENGDDICVSGFLGWDVIQHFKWAFRAADRRFSLEKPDGPNTVHNMAEWDGMPLLRVRFQGEERLFGFDTGNTESVIGKALYPFFEGSREIRDTFVGVDGTKDETVRIVENFAIEIDGCKIELPNVAAVNRDVFPSGNPEVCGLLAADIIQGRNWMLDYGKRVFQICT